MKLNNIDLNKLKCFQAVAEKNSLMEGAKHLNLTSSAVYQSIKKLEEEIQINLFFRSGKKYVLTDEGRNLQTLFQKFLWDLAVFQDTPSISEGEIRVGLPLNFSKQVFVPILKKFNQEFPKVSFHLVVGETRRLIEEISQFKLDFAITDDSIPQEFESRIEKREVFREELVLVCAEDFYKSREADFKSLKLMKDLPHLDYSKNLPLIQRWYRLHYKKQVKVGFIHSVDNVETMLTALSAGLGLGVIPKDLLNKNLKVISTQGGRLYNYLYLVQDANYVNNTLLKKFLLQLETELKK